MILAQEIINDNGISTIALGFFTVLLGAVSTLGVAVINARHKTEELTSVTVKAAESAEAAQQNTQNVSNGFVSRMDRKLDLLAVNQDRLEEKHDAYDEKIDRLSQSFQEHLEWHLSKET